MGWYGQHGGYIQAMFANNGIPAYFCFVGRDSYREYPVVMQTNNVPVLFYDYEPPDFNFLYEGLFERVTFPSVSGARRVGNGNLWGERVWSPTTNGVRSYWNQDDDDYHCALYNVTYEWWKVPHPEDPIVPYTCHGRLVLPEPIVSHWTCKELSQCTIKSIITRLKCDESFFTVNVDECNFHSKRTIHYAWLIIHATNASASAECDGELPQDDIIDCDYFPVKSASFIVQSVLFGLVSIWYMVIMVVVFHFRDSVMIRYGGLAFLEVMLFGGLLMYLFVIARSGKPTKLLCGLRPCWLCFGFTCIVSSLLAKAFQTFKLSFYRPTKRHLNANRVRRQAHRLLAWLFVADSVLLLLWLGMAFPTPKLVDHKYTNIGLRVMVHNLECSNSSMVYTEVLGLLKVLVVLLRLVISLRSSHVHFDYGEHFWLVSAMILVCVMALLLGGLEIRVSLSQNVLCVFENSMAQAGSFVCFGQMTIPKLLHIHDIEKFNDVGDSLGKSSANMDNTFECRADHPTPR